MSGYFSLLPVGNIGIVGIFCHNIPYRQSANVSRHNANFPTDSRQKYPDNSNITYRQSTKVSRHFQYYLQTVDKNIPTIIIFPTDSRQKYPDDSIITYRQSAKVCRQFQYYLQTVDKNIPTYSNELSGYFCRLCM
jgi:uncharacterized short protein YbdD (DUF466 family)